MGLEVSLIANFLNTYKRYKGKKMELKSFREFIAESKSEKLDEVFKPKSIKEVVSALYDVEATTKNNYGTIAGICAEYIKDNL